MKKRHRNIVVDDQAYTWSVSNIDERHVRLRVWRPKKVLLADVRLRFDDPWKNYGVLLAAHAAGRHEELAQVLELRPVTPGEVAMVIRVVLAHECTGKAFEWSREHGLRPSDP